MPIYGHMNNTRSSIIADLPDPIVPGGIIPDGNITITSNGVVDVYRYATATIDVPSSGEGTLTITSNGTYDVTSFANVEVDVEGGVEPTPPPQPIVYIPTQMVSVNGNGILQEVSIDLNNPPSELPLTIDGVDYLLSPDVGAPGVIFYAYYGEFSDYHIAVYLPMGRDEWNLFLQEGNQPATGNYLVSSMSPAEETETIYIPEQSVTVGRLQPLETNLGSAWYTPLPEGLPITIEGPVAVKSSSVHNGWGVFSGSGYTIYDINTGNQLGSISYMDMDIPAGWYFFTEYWSTGTELTISSIETVDPSDQLYLSLLSKTFVEFQGQRSNWSMADVSNTSKLIIPSIYPVLELVCDDEPFTLRWFQSENRWMSLSFTLRQCANDDGSFDLQIEANNLTGFHFIKIRVPLPTDRCCITTLHNVNADQEVQVADFFGMNNILPPLIMGSDQMLHFEALDEYILPLTSSTILCVATVLPGNQKMFFTLN